MEQIARPQGFFMLFRFFGFTQYMPYIAIGILVAAIVVWIIFARKKLRWAKILAIVLTVLVVITGILSFTPQIISAVTGRQMPMGGPGGMDFPTGDGEQFRDFRDREDSEDNGQQPRDFREGPPPGEQNSGLDMNILELPADYKNIEVAV